MEHNVKADEGPPLKRQRLTYEVNHELHSTANDKSLRDDLWNKLPAEIRNEIYELMIDAKSINSPFTMTYWSNSRYKSYWRTTSTAAKRSVLLCVSLLHVSKQIRKEFGSVLFGTCSFYVTNVDGDDLPKVGKFIASLVHDFDLKDFGQFTLYLDKPIRQDVRYFKALADLLYSTKISNISCLSIDGSPVADASFKIEVRVTYKRVIYAMGKALALGLYARDNGLTQDQFEERWALLFKRLRQFGPIQAPALTS